MFKEFLQTVIVPDDKIKEAQNKIDKILHNEDNKKDSPDSYWHMSNELFEIIDIITILIGCRTIK